MNMQLGLVGNGIMRLAIFTTFLIVVYSGNSNAAEVIFEDVRFITGIEGVNGHNTQFTINSSGIYEAEMVDFVFPEEFDSLGLLISEGTNELGSQESNGGGFSFTFEAHPGLHFANVFGDAGGSLNIGLYGLKISKISSVPLPTALVLFLSSLVFLGFFTDKGRGWRNKLLARTYKPLSLNVA